MKILVIEDDNDTAQFIARSLRKAGHSVELAKNAEEGRLFARTRAHDMAVVDRMLPGADGLSLVKAFREEQLDIPILFLTALGGLHDRVEGLEAGGDDYLVKPFAVSELLARVNSLTRRAKRVGATAQTDLRVGDLELDLINQTVTRSGKRIDLQPQEFRLLEFLMRHAGHVITKTMLLENVWDLHFDPKTTIVESNMSRLRTKLDRQSASPMIHTIRGAGYVLRAE